MTVENPCCERSHRTDEILLKNSQTYDKIMIKMI